MLRHLLVIAVVLLAGCSTTTNLSTPTPTPTPEVVDREVSTGTVSLEGLPVSQSFRFQNGAVRIAFPIHVEFLRPVGENWTIERVVTVGEMEWFTVELAAEQHYRIVIQDADGDRRAMGLYTPVKRDVEYTIIIGGCCVDDFSGGGT